MAFIKIIDDDNTQVLNRVKNRKQVLLGIFLAPLASVAILFFAAMVIPSEITTIPQFLVIAIALGSIPAALFYSLISIVALIMMITRRKKNLINEKKDVVDRIDTLVEETSNNALSENKAIINTNSVSEPVDDSKAPQITVVQDIVDNSTIDSSQHSLLEFGFRKGEISQDNLEKYNDINQKYSKFFKEHTKNLEKLDQLYDQYLNPLDTETADNIVEIIKEDAETIIPKLLEYHDEVNSTFHNTEMLAGNDDKLDSEFIRFANLFHEKGAYIEEIIICQYAIKLGFIDDGTEHGMNGRIEKAYEILQAQIVSEEESDAVSGEDQKAEELVVEDSAVKPENDYFATINEELIKRFSDDRGSIKEYLINVNQKGTMMPIGRNQTGNIVYRDIDDMVHMHVTGVTGSGKTYFVQALLTYLIMHNSPEELGVMIYDSKQVDYGFFENIPHLICPILSDTMDFINVIKGLVASRSRNDSNLPNRVLVIADDYSSLQTYDTFDESFIKLLEVGRAQNIDVIMVSTLTIESVVRTAYKYGVTDLVSFRVTSQKASNIAVGTVGAEKLRVPGELLHSVLRQPLSKVNAIYLTNEDSYAIREVYAEYYSGNQYSKALVDVLNRAHGSDKSYAGKDPLFREAVIFFIRSDRPSIEDLQRKYSISRGRAINLVQQMERRGVLSFKNHNEIVMRIKSIKDVNL